MRRAMASTAPGELVCCILANAQTSSAMSRGLNSAMRAGTSRPAAAARSGAAASSRAYAHRMLLSPFATGNSDVSCRAQTAGLGRTPRSDS